jgi:hypothetical protein
VVVIEGAPTMLAGLVGIAAIIVAVCVVGNW